MPPLATNDVDGDGTTVRTEHFRTKKEQNEIHDTVVEIDIGKKEEIISSHNEFRCDNNNNNNNKNNNKNTGTLGLWKEEGEKEATERTNRMEEGNEENSDNKNSGNEKVTVTTKTQPPEEDDEVLVEINTHRRPDHNNDNNTVQRRIQIELAAYLTEKEEIEKKLKMTIEDLKKGMEKERAVYDETIANLYQQICRQKKEPPAEDGNAKSKATTSATPATTQNTPDCRCRCPCPCSGTTSSMGSDKSRQHRQERTTSTTATTNRPFSFSFSLSTNHTIVARQRRSRDVSFSWNGSSSRVSTSNKRRTQSSPVVNINPLASKKRKRWTQEEDVALRSGLSMFGQGQWKEIKCAFPTELRDRTVVNLKDRHRTLVNQGKI